MFHAAPSAAYFDEMGRWEQGTQLHRFNVGEVAAWYLVSDFSVHRSGRGGCSSSPALSSGSGATLAGGALEKLAIPCAGLPSTAPVVVY